MGAAIAPADRAPGGGLLLEIPDQERLVISRLRHGA